LSRWTKYAKRGILSNNNKQHRHDDLPAQSALLSRKMISVALKCVSKKVLQHLDDGFDRLTLEVDNL
jgi:hypothetical protein